MIRIFFTLATLSIILLVAAMFVGLTIGDLYAKPLADRETLAWASVHRLTGVAAALGVVFVESIVVTYFIGTSRWCKEVVETYRFDPAPVAASNRLKRKTFPWALAGMLAVVVVISLGAAADPARIRPPAETQWWRDWHLIGSMLGIVFVGWTYLIAWNNIVANHSLIEQLVAEVGKVRRERGLDDEKTGGNLVPQVSAPSGGNSA